MSDTLPPESPRAPKQFTNRDAIKSAHDLLTSLAHYFAAVAGQNPLCGMAAGLLAGAAAQVELLQAILAEAERDAAKDQKPPDGSSIN